jgi:hypothetical protein
MCSETNIFCVPTPSLLNDSTGAVPASALLDETGAAILDETGKPIIAE